MGDDNECDIEEEEEEVTAVADSSSSAYWSELHEDYLQQILKKFTSVPDCLRFGAVCVSWRNILVPHIHSDLLNPQLPLLLIPAPPASSLAEAVEEEEEEEQTKSFHSTSEEEEKRVHKEDIEIIKLPVPVVHVPPSSSTSTSTAVAEQTRSLYSISEKRVYKDIEIKLPYNRHCRGSSHGWLITSGVEDTGFAVELINPLVSINNENYLKIQLPPLTVLPEDPDQYIFGYHYLTKAVLSANPLTNPKDYVVMAIYGGYCLLAFWKPGDQVWNPVPFRGGAANLDVIYHKGLFYIVNTQGHVFVCDLGSAGTATNSTSIGCDDDQPHRPIKVWKIATSPIPKNPGGIEKYLLKLPYSDDLIMVHRFHTIVRGEVAHNPHSTIGFSVFKLLVEDKEQGCIEEYVEEEEENEESPYSSKWMLMSNLENQMFFVGDNASMSLPASEFPGGKPNHIYFTHDNVYDNKDGFVDMGVFDYKGWIIEQIHPMGSNDYILPVTTIWVEPTLRCCLRF